MTRGRGFESLQVDDLGPVPAPRSRLVLAGTAELPPEMSFLAAVQAQRPVRPALLREETILERASRTGEPLRCGTLVDLVPPAEIDAVIRESFDAHFEGAFLREVERGMGLPSGTLIADVPAPALFAAEYQNEPPPAPTIEELREFVRTEDRGRVRIGSVLADCPETVRRAFAAADPPSLPVADVFGIPVQFSALVRPGTIALLDRSGVPLLVVDVPAAGATT